METLRDLYLSKGGYNYYPTDKDTVHCYLNTYDRLFRKFKDEKINVLELGVSEGGSIRLWSEYFINARVFGYDINKTARPNIFNERVNYVIKDINLVAADEFKDTPLTIALDDGSHILEDQLAFIKIMYPQIVPGGMVLVEDIMNLDVQKPIFQSLGIPFEIIDLRNIHGMYNDVILVFNK